MIIETTEQNPIVSVWTKDVSEYEADGVKGYMNLTTAAAIHDFDIGNVAEKLILVGRNFRISVRNNDNELVFLELERTSA